MTRAERVALHRSRNGPGNAFVTSGSNENVTGRVTPAPQTPVSSSEVVSSRDKNLQLRKEATEVLGFLNQKASRSYRFTPTNLGFIEARLREGATVQQCKSVIARQVRAWISDPKMTPYLRPETLFNRTKFESYVGLSGPESEHV